MRTKVPDDYVIGSGDSLSIFVYRNPDLSEAGVAVRPDGRISTPLIEDIVGGGQDAHATGARDRAAADEVHPGAQRYGDRARLHRAARPAGAGDR